MLKVNPISGKIRKNNSKCRLPKKKYPACETFKTSADDTLKYYFSYFSKNTDFDISCKLSHGGKLHEISNPK